jgi:hypothetical protein
MRRPRPTVDAYVGAPFGRRAAHGPGAWPEEAAVAATFDAFGSSQTLSAAVAPSVPEELLHTSALDVLALGNSSDPQHRDSMTPQPGTLRMAGAPEPNQPPLTRTA